MFYRLINEMAPTHRCGKCGAFWRYWPGDELSEMEAFWNLRSRKCGECCETSVNTMNPCTLLDVSVWVAQSVRNSVKDSLRPLGEKLYKFFNSVTPANIDIPPDPTKHCQVYKACGCVHVDGPLCDVRTCEVKVTITPKTIESS